MAEHCRNVLPVWRALVDYYLVTTSASPHHKTFMLFGVVQKQSDFNFRGNFDNNNNKGNNKGNKTESCSG